MWADMEPTYILQPSQRQRLSYEGVLNAKNILLETNVRIKLCKADWPRKRDDHPEGLCKVTIICIQTAAQLRARGWDSANNDSLCKPHQEGMNWLPLCLVPCIMCNLQQAHAVNNMDISTWWRMTIARPAAHACGPSSSCCHYETC